MSQQMELFDIVEPDLHWIAGGDVMKASRFSSSASENDALMEEPSKTQLEQADTRGVAKSGIVREIPDKAAVLVGPTRARSCYPLLKAPEHIFGGQQTAEEQTHSKLPAEECRHHTPADYRVSVKDVEAERPPRRVVFDSQDAPPSRRGMPGPNVDFVTGNPLPFYVPYSVHDKTAIFESRFESGNLRRATQIGPFEYELLVRTDVNTSGHMQWFYFSISNLTMGTTIQLNIVNMYKPNSLFSLGMKPLIYSNKRAAAHNIGWIRGGRNIKYYETQTSGYEGLYTLSFEFDVPEADDVLYFAQCFPFTWSYQQNVLSEIIEKHASKGIVKRELLCESLNGNRCDVLTITDFNLEQTSSLEQRSRPCVFLTARVHPGESNSSWIMKGIIDHLLGDSDVAKELRARFYFVLIPMLNPDGVINGNYRCNLAGFDLNRNWKSPDPTKHRPIFATKQLMQSIQKSREILFFCDFHGHSAKHNVFMYGCETGSGPQRLMEKVFPCIMSRIAGVFSFGGSSFKMKKEKESTGRIVVRKQFNVTYSYTFEASFFGCDFGPHCGQHFSVEHYLAIGRRFLDAILLWSNPDNSWTEASLEYLKNLYPDKQCEANEDSVKPQAASVAITPATKPAISISIPKSCQYAATPPMSKRLLSVAPPRSQPRQPFDPGAFRDVVKKK